MNILPIEVVALLRRSEDDATNTDPIVIVDDKACRPLISVTEASWSELPPLCRHAPAHARNLKKISVSRWDGVDYTNRRPWEKAPHHLDPSAPYCITAKIVQAQKSPHKPTRKASIDMSAASNYSLKKPMRKASMEMSALDISEMDLTALDITALKMSAYNNTLRRPNRKASMEMCTLPA